MAEFGEILQHIGDFGLYQKLTLVALCFPFIIFPFHFASIYFIQSDPERHCNTDWILTTDPNLTIDEQLNLTLPREEDGTFSKCQMFVPVDWNISNIREYGLNETTACQNGWVYYNTMYTSTIVTDFDLVCDQAPLVQLAQTVLMTGILVGSVLFGPFGESLGRKPAIHISVILMLLFTVTGGLSSHFCLYLGSQFMLGVAFGGYRLNSIVLATEWIGISKRSWGSCVTQIFNSVGQCVLAGIIYIIRDWRLAHLLTAIPLTVVAIYIWFIQESARWLLDRGMTKEAKQLITKVSVFNKCTVPDSLLENVVSTNIFFMRLIIVKDTKKNRSIIILIQSPVFRKYFCVLLLAWFSSNVTYCWLSFNVGNFGLDIFLTQALFGLTRLPVHILCIWLLEALGRKMSLMSTLLIGGLLCLLMLTVSQSNAVAVTVLATTVRILTDWAGNVCAVYVQEVSSTSFRQTALSFGTIASRLGGLLSPLLTIMGICHWSIPIILSSSLILVSGAFSFLLPETRNKELPN